MYMKNNTLRIGTRNSPLALKQVEIFRTMMAAVHPDLVMEAVPIKSAADWKMQDGEKSLSEQAGGKGQFAKEIEKMLLEDVIDCGVHSLKDMASFLPEGLVINHYLPRADARDAFVSEKYKSIDDLPDGAVVGTCSPRRLALCLARRPDVKIVPFRGNVQTRLDKVKAGQVDATFLAMAGLTRLGINNEMIHPLSVEEMLPACGQGIVCIETREGDEHVQAVLNKVHCHETGFCAAAEREVLKVLDGSCHTPIGAYATIKNGQLNLRVIVAALDGQELYQDIIDGVCPDVKTATQMGRDIGTKLKSILPKGFSS